MATYSVPGQNLTYNLPDEGQTYRLIGDDTQGTVYKIVNGVPQAITQKQTYASTDMRAPDGTIIKAGQSLGQWSGSMAYLEGWNGARDANSLTILNPSFRGNNTYNMWDKDIYDQQNGAGSWGALPTFNGADLNQVLQRLGGAFTAGATGYTQGVAPNNANAATITTNTGQLLTGPAPAPQPGALDPAQVGMVNPNAALQVPGGTQPGAATPGAAPAAPTTAASTVNAPTAALQPGMTGDAVKQLQDYLVSQGLMTREQVNTGYGTYGPQTTAAVLALQQKLGVDNASGPGFFGPKTMAAIAAASGGAAGAAPTVNPSGATTTPPGTTPSVLGTSSDPTANDPYAGLDPVAKQVRMYTDASSALGLPTIKQKYNEVVQQQADLTNEMNDKISDVQSNPWFSQGLVDKNVQKIKDNYATRLDTLVHLETLYDSIYKQGLATVETIVSKANADITAMNSLAQKQMDAATALAKDNQVVSVGGRELLINKTTGKTVADLGPTPAATAAAAKAATAATTSSSTSSTGAKGTQTNSQFVSSTLKTQGLTYDAVLSAIPSGKIGVIKNSNGQIGTISPGEYDPALYTYL